MIDPAIDTIGLMTLVWLVVLTLFGRSLLVLVRLLVRDVQFLRLLGVVVLLIASGAQIYHRIEGWNYLDALYFTVITLTTVGYGDFSPQTNIGKVFSMLYILMGLGVLGAMIALISEKSHAWAAALQLRGRRKQDRD